MPMFRKRPVVVEARQYWDNDSAYELLHWINEKQSALGRKFATWVNGRLTIPTLEGDHEATPGDWIIRGVAGEHYPCKPDIFTATYEPELIVCGRINGGHPCTLPAGSHCPDCKAIHDVPEGS
jgi:hypothetical protein